MNRYDYFLKTYNDSVESAQNRAIIMSDAVHYGTKVASTAFKPVVSAVQDVITAGVIATRDIRAETSDIVSSIGSASLKIVLSDASNASKIGFEAVDKVSVHAAATAEQITGTASQLISQTITEATNTSSSIASISSHSSKYITNSIRQTLPRRVRVLIEHNVNPNIL